MAFSGSSSPGTLARAFTCQPGAQLSGYELPNNLSYYACGTNPYNMPSTFAHCCAGPVINVTTAHPNDDNQASCIAYCRVTNDQPKQGSPCSSFTYGTDFYDCLNQPQLYGQSYNFFCLGAHGNSNPSPQEGLGGSRNAQFQNDTALCEQISFSTGGTSNSDDSDGVNDSDEGTSVDPGNDEDDGSVAEKIKNANVTSVSNLVLQVVHDLAGYLSNR